MKTKTEKILTVMKYLALLAAIGFSIECGSEILSFVASFINPAWAERVYHVDLSIFSIRQQSVTLYVYAMFIVIAVSALKSTVWYLVVDLLQKLRLQSPFTMLVTEKLEKIAYLLLAIWVIMSLIGKTYSHYLVEYIKIESPVITSGDEYLFISGMVYIISQIFKRGVEIQEENELTV